MLKGLANNNRTVQVVQLSGGSVTYHDWTLQLSDYTGLYAIMHDSTDVYVKSYRNNPGDPVLHAVLGGDFNLPTLAMDWKSHRSWEPRLKHLTQTGNSLDCAIFTYIKAWTPSPHCTPHANTSVNLKNLTPAINVYSGEKKKGETMNYQQYKGNHSSEANRHKNDRKSWPQTHFKHALTRYQWDTHSKGLD